MPPKKRSSHLLRLKDESGNIDFASSAYSNRARAALTADEYEEYLQHRSEARLLNPDNPDYLPYEDFSEKLRKSKIQSQEALKHFASKIYPVAPSSGTNLEEAKAAADAPVSVHAGAFSQFLQSASAAAVEKYEPPIDSPLHRDQVLERWKKSRFKFYALMGFDKSRQEREEKKFDTLLPTQQQYRMDHIRRSLVKMEHPEISVAERSAPGKPLDSWFELERRKIRFKYYEIMGYPTEVIERKEEEYAKKTGYERNNVMHWITRAVKQRESEEWQKSHTVPSPVPEDYVSDGDEKLPELELNRKRVRKTYAKYKGWTPDQARAYEKRYWAAPSFERYRMTIMAKRFIERQTKKRKELEARLERYKKSAERQSVVSDTSSSPSPAVVERPVESAPTLAPPELIRIPSSSASPVSSSSEEETSASSISSPSSSEREVSSPESVDLDAPYFISPPSSNWRNPKFDMTVSPNSSDEEFPTNEPIDMGIPQEAEPIKHDLAMPDTDFDYPDMPDLEPIKKV